MNKVLSIIFSIMLNLQLFADEATYNANKTTDTAMSAEMKTFYDTELLENSRERQVFNQFAKIVKMKGGSAEFRRPNTFDKALTPIQEGVTPTGSKFGYTYFTANITQHGDYTTVTDRLEYESYDPVISDATEEMGYAMGETSDTLTRNVVIQGNSVVYAPKSDGTLITQRSDLDITCLINPRVIKKARTWLRNNKVPTIDGWYICIINPDVAEDLTESDEWKEYHKYRDVEPIFKGEIGQLHGFRFIETSEAKIHEGAAGNGTLATYDTLLFGKDSYGLLDPEGEGAQMIVKDKKEIGGPLELYSTIGYKFCHAAKILYQERLLRLESCSSYSMTATEN